MERKKEQAAGGRKTEEDSRGRREGIVPRWLSAARDHPELNLIHFCFPISTMDSAGFHQFYFID
jgi:hypothetical protein